VCQVGDKVSVVSIEVFVKLVLAEELLWLVPGRCLLMMKALAMSPRIRRESMLMVSVSIVAQESRAYMNTSADDDVYGFARVLMFMN